MAEYIEERYDLLALLQLCIFTNQDKTILLVLLYTNSRY
jgi:hypothetical protein